MQFNDLQTITKNFNILYIEDDINFRDDFIPVLKNFFHTVDIAYDGKEGYDKYISYFENHQSYYDIVISDIEMPNIDGIELSELIYKKNKQQMIVIVSAYDTPKYLIKFINIGVEYFLLKPFELHHIIEVFSKISMKLLTSSKNKELVIVELTEGLYWNYHKLTLIHAGNKIQLSAQETLFLDILIKNKNHVVIFNEIFCTIWGERLDLASKANLNPLITRLKKKLPEDIIKSIYGIGYMMEI